MFISSEKEMFTVKRQTNRIFSVLLTLVMLLSLLPMTAVAAGVTVVRVVATAVNVTPAIGKKAVVSVTDVTITEPTDLSVRVDPDQSRHYWRYSADGEEWTNYYASDNEPFKQGYWECRLNFWIASAGSIEFSDACTVNMNGTLWSCSVADSGKLLYARSPVYVLDSSGSILEEINSVSLNCETFPSLFTGGKEPTEPGDYTTTAGLAVIDKSKDVWQVREGDAWRDLAATETCVGGSAYRLKTTLTLPENHGFLVTLGRAVTLTVNGNAWTVDHASMKDSCTTKASVTVYSHTVYAANETCTITFYDVNKPSGQNVVGTLEVPGGEYILPKCTFPSSHKDIIFDYWEYEDVDGTDVKKQPGETIVLLQDSTIYLYWKWKPGVNKVTFDAAVSVSYAPGIKAKDISLSLEAGQHVSLVDSGYGEAYWLECGSEEIASDTELSTAGSYDLVVNFRLEDGFMAAFTENSVTLSSDVLGELACRTPVEQDDGSYIARFSLPPVPGTPISANQVVFTLGGYETGKMVQAIRPSINTEEVVFNGSGYGKHANGCAYLIYMESDEAYVYQEPVYDSTSFWASTDYWLDIWFTLEEGYSLPDSFWSGGSLVKEKFVLNGVESAKVETVSRSADGFYIRFKLPQLDNEPIGAVRITLNGYESGKMAQNVVVTVSENISPFRYTPQEHYQNQHYYFYTPGSEGYDDVVGASTTFREGDAYSFAVWMNIAKGYDASDISPSDIVICTPYGDRIAKTIEMGSWENSYKVTFVLPAIGTENPSYSVTLDPGEGTGGAFHKAGYYAGTEYTLPQMKDVAFTAPEGMIFKSWSVGGNEMQSGEKVTITGYTLVTALWKPYTSVTVTEIEIRNLSAPIASVAYDKNGAHAGTTADSDVYRIATRSWYDVTAGRTMENGDAFIEGNTYRYTFTIVLKDSAYGKFAASTDDISVTVAGAYEITKANPSGNMLMCKAFFVCKAIEPVVSGSVTVSGATASASVAVKGLEGAEAVLIVVQYSGSQMKAVRCQTVTSDCIVIPEAFDHSAGFTYKAFLVSNGLWMPLCSAAALTQ